MGHRRLRSLSAASLVIGSIAVLGVPLTLARAVKTVPGIARLLDTQAWFMGGSGQPIPSMHEVTEITTRYINPTSPLFDGQPDFPVTASHSVFTPEGLYPLTGVKSLGLDTSMDQGVGMINSTIMSQVATGDDVVVAGGSQSATIESLEMRKLLALPADQQPTSDQLSFVVIGDPSNPDGGLLERFGDASLPPLSLESWGVTFSGATPSDTPWDTAVYTLEYDGFADFPRYPLDFLADLNALIGIAAVHPTYPQLTDARMASTVELPVSEDYTGHTQYFMIPTENLPLLAPLRYLPVLGNPLADLLQPDLRVLVNLGYGDIAHGWDQGPANVPTPFGLFPDVDPGDVLKALVSGAAQGVEDFVHDLESVSLPSLGALFEGVSEAVSGGVADSLPGFTDIVNTFSAVVASAYAALLPMADTVNALTTALPMYDASLFVQELASGNLIDAIGMPIAANLGLTPVLVGVGVIVPVLHAAEDIVRDLQDILPS